MDALEKAELTTSISHIARFFKSGIPIYNSKDSEIAEKREEEEEQEEKDHWLLQCVMCFTQT